MGERGWYLLVCTHIVFHSTVTSLSAAFHVFVGFFPPVFSDLSVCAQFLGCKPFSWMDEGPKLIHHRSYPPSWLLFLYHPAVKLTSDVPISSLLGPARVTFSAGSKRTIKRQRGKKGNDEI